MFGLLYPLGSAFFRVGLHVAAFSGHEKARKAVAGRRDGLSVRRLPSEKQGRGFTAFISNTNEAPSQGAPGPGPRYALSSPSSPRPGKEAVPAGAADR